MDDSITPPESLPETLLPLIFQGFSCAVNAGLRSLCTLLRDMLPVQKVTVDVRVLRTGEVCPALPLRLPMSDRKHLRIHMDDLRNGESTPEHERFTQSLTASLPALHKLDTLHLSGAPEHVLPCFCALMDTGCLSQVTDVNLEIHHDGFLALDLSPFVAKLRTLSTLASLDLDYLTFDDLNTLGEMTSLKEIRTYFGRWIGKTLTLPHVVKLDIGHNRCDFDWTFNEKSFPAVTHLAIDVPGLDTYLNHILNLGMSLESLSVDLEINGATIELLNRLHPNLHTLDIEKTLTIHGEPDPVMPSLRSLSCRTDTMERLMGFAPNVTSLEMNARGYGSPFKDILSGLPPQVTSLKATPYDMEFSSGTGFGTVTKLHLVVPFDYTEAMTLASFPNLVEFIIEAQFQYLHDDRSDDSALYGFVAALMCPRPQGPLGSGIRSLTVCEWFVTKRLVRQLVKMVHLTHLRLDCCSVAPHLIKRILRGLPGLVRMDVFDCKEGSVSKLQCQQIAQEAAGGTRDIAFRLVCDRHV